LKKGKWFLIILPVAAMLTSGIVSYFLITPIYKSSTTLMVGKTYAGENGPLLQYNDILTANQLVKTYSQIAKSRTVAEKIIEQEKLDITPEAFSDKISVEPVRDTQLISISIEDPSPDKAARLANISGQVFMKKVVEVMKLDNVNIVDPAVPAPSPVKPNKKMNILLAGVIGLMSAVGLVFLLEFLDQTIKTNEDINRYLELPVLGVIPKIDA
jgi:capsular polysaccharide biosynthesis protein